MSDLISRRALLAKYDKNHVGPPGGARRLIESAPAVEAAEWIPVERELPTPYVSVLVYMPGERPRPTVREGYMSTDGEWAAGYFRRQPGEVVAWRPMPEPPEREEVLE